MYELENVLRPYAWGSTTAIAGLLGRQASGGPEAELWIGAHPDSPSVALSTGVAAGFAYVVARDSLVLFHDGRVSIKWGVMNDDFGKNQVRCRVEGRFQMGVVRPIGVVQVDLTA